MSSFEQASLARILFGHRRGHGLHGLLPSARKLLVVVPSSPEMPSGIVRVEQFLPRIRAMGFEVELMHYFPPPSRRGRWREAGRRRLGTLGGLAGAAAASAADALHVWAARLRILRGTRSCDAILLQWIALPRWLTNRIAASRARLIYDFDDAVYLVNVDRVDAQVRAAWRVVVGSHALLDYAAVRNPATALVPSSIEPADFVPPFAVARAASSPRRVTIGWIGSATTVPYLAELAAPLRELADHGREVELLVAGTQGREVPIPALPGVRLTTVHSYSGSEIPSLAARMDIGVLPMPDGPWERGKCAMKALIYMAAGLPVVCSPVGENVHVVEEGVSGLHASTPDEWFDALNRLARSGELRQRLGRAGRARVEAGYTTEHCFELLRRHVLAPLSSRDATDQADSPEHYAREHEATAHEETETRTTTGARPIG